MKEDVYHKLQTTFNKRNGKDFVMVIGNLNTKVVSDNRNLEASIETHGEGVITLEQRISRTYMVPQQCLMWPWGGCDQER